LKQRLFHCLTLDDEFLFDQNLKFYQESYYVGQKMSKSPTKTSLSQVDQGCFTWANDKENPKTGPAYELAKQSEIISIYDKGIESEEPTKKIEKIAYEVLSS
jgi:hypothetical protein